LYHNTAICFSCSHDQHFRRHKEKCEPIDDEIGAKPKYRFPILEAIELVPLRTNGLSVLFAGGQVKARAKGVGRRTTRIDDQDQSQCQGRR
tara:strand:- start:722 stop:994 length:273 start_codon:yes stop_codon:yes gene_type:complete